MGTQQGREQFIRRQREASVDHDLLIEIKVKLESLAKDVADGASAAQRQISDLALQTQKQIGEHAALDAQAFKDHESRLRTIETRMYMGLGALALLEFGMKLFWK